MSQDMKSIFDEKLAAIKGGPGSGRYPKGSGRDSYGEARRDAKNKEIAKIGAVAERRPAIRDNPRPGQRNRAGTGTSIGKVTTEDQGLSKSVFLDGNHIGHAVKNISPGPITKYNAMYRPPEGIRPGRAAGSMAFQNYSIGVYSTEQEAIARLVSYHTNRESGKSSKSLSFKSLAESIESRVAELKSQADLSSSIAQLEVALEMALKGGQGSGNFGHSGRPGERGGSGEGGGSNTVLGRGMSKETLAADTNQSDREYIRQNQKENYTAAKHTNAKDLQNDLVDNIDGSQTFNEAGILSNNSGLVGKDGQDANEFKDDIQNFLEDNDYSTYSFSESDLLTKDDGIVAENNESGRKFEITFSTTSNRTPTATIIQIQSRSSKSISSDEIAEHAASFNRALGLLREGKSLPDDLATRVDEAIKIYIK